ncbi:unnamed protein product [Penicillium glandicola]
MGGGACGDNKGIGSSPKASIICYDGRAWYLHCWKNNGVFSLTSHHWGWVVTPPGLGNIGQGDHSGINIADVINSSLNVWAIACYNYNSDTTSERVSGAIKTSWVCPRSQGASWEGVFTIPMYHVRSTIDSNDLYREYVLQAYGHDSCPVWCGPICSGDVHTTQDYIKAANMEGFDSPKHLCKDKPYY